MKLGYDLTLEQSQKLIMTPELRQAIEMLQFNSMELKDYISKELDENPVLESASSGEEFENIEEYTKDKEVDWKEYLEKYDDISYRSQRDKNIEDHNYEAFTTNTDSLNDHLMLQLSFSDLSDKEYEIGENIIQNINDNGYLSASLEEISQGTKTSIIEVEKILELVQQFEPIGVGARNIKECLLIQVRDDKRVEPKIIKIIEEYLEDIASNKIQKIAKELNIETKEVQNAFDYIKGLEPKPGRLFHGNADDIRYITPDAEIQLVEGEFIVIIKEITGPRLNINSYYKELMKTAKDKDTIEFLNDRFNRAMWVIRSIDQRRSTIRKVIESILKFQMEFFQEGEQYLRPLTLKDIAEDIEMHESTVSRATNGKYVQTPRGLFELKYFFSSGLLGSDGDVSSTSIKSMLKDIIDGEDIKKPYSDQRLSEILKEKEINISRRTIAKYRDELNIPSSSMRRRY